MEILIYADFMKVDPEDRVILTTRGTFEDLERYDLKLQPGLRLTFYNPDADMEGNPDDLIVEGIVERDVENDRWLAVVNWDDVKNRSELSADDIARLGLE